MPVIAYPSVLPSFVKASKTRRQAAPFSGEEVRRGYAHFKATGPDTPVYWDVTFRFNRFQAIQFWLWFTLKLRRGINEFTIPIDTEGTLSTHRCRFVPDSLLPAQEYGGVWTYTATIESRGIIQGEPAQSPFVPTTIAHVNFDAYPPEDLVLTNRSYSLMPDEYTVLTADALAGSTGYALMQQDDGSAAEYQTESNELDNNDSGYVFDRRLGLDGVTFEAFVKVAPGSGEWEFFLQGAIATTEGISLDVFFQAGNVSFKNGGNEYLDSYYFDSDGDFSPNDSDTGLSSFSFPKDAWVHVAVVMDGLNFRAYVDGDLVKTFTADSGPATGLANYSFQYLWFRNNGSIGSEEIYIDCMRATSGALYSGSSFTPPSSRFAYPLE